MAILVPQNINSEWSDHEPNHLVQFIVRRIYHGVLSNNPTFIQCRIVLDNTNNPPMQTNKSVKAPYTHALLSAVFATRPHPLCCIALIMVL